jgi:hypothetical protein
MYIDVIFADIRDDAEALIRSINEVRFVSINWFEAK